jgi:hypothetical protein
VPNIAGFVVVEDQGLEKPIYLFKALLDKLRSLRSQRKPISLAVLVTT